MSTVTAIDLAEPMTQTKFGELVGISQQAVAELVKRGVLAEGAAAGEWLLAYTGRLREQAAGRWAGDELDLARERAGLARAQRERIEMLNAQAKRELLPVALLERVLARLARQIAGTLEALPVQLKRQSPNLSAEDLDLINREIARIRNAAAAVELEDGDGSLGAEASDPAGALAAAGGGTEDTFAVG